MKGAIVGPGEGLRDVAGRDRDDERLGAVRPAAPKIQAIVFQGVGWGGALDLVRCRGALWKPSRAKEIENAAIQEIRFLIPGRDL